eukprot:m.43349 g.43349  ORF g.43349 m.43349 type:complete len:339 (-) comp5776_c0_seq2:951-1967(-)
MELTDYDFARMRLSVAIFSLWCLFPCFVVLLRFRLHHLQSERFLFSLLTSSAILDVGVAFVAADTMQNSLVESAGGNVGKCISSIALLYGAIYSCMIFEGFVVVYSFHLINSGKNFSSRKEKAIHIFLWVLGICAATAMALSCISTCPGPDVCTLIRFVILSIYAGLSFIFLGVYVLMLLQYRRLLRLVNGIENIFAFYSKVDRERRVRLARLAAETSGDIIRALRFFPATFLFEVSVGAFAAYSYYQLHTDATYNQTHVTMLNWLGVAQPLHGLCVSIVYFCDPEHLDCLRRMCGRRPEPEEKALLTIDELEEDGTLSIQGCDIGDPGELGELGDDN